MGDACSGQQVKGKAGRGGAMLRDVEVIEREHEEQLVPIPRRSRESEPSADSRKKRRADQDPALSRRQPLGRAFEREPPLLQRQSVAPHRIECILRPRSRGSWPRRERPGLIWLLTSIVTMSGFPPPLMM